jgi:prepilin-type N-terminal cleavage/methylation domain-containing protein
MPRLRSHGFTLVELLVVIAIMVVLMSLVFPIAKSALESADRSACMSNLHLIGQGVLAYQQDYFAFPSAPNYVGVGGVPQGGVTGLAITNPNIVASTFWCSKDPYPQQFAVGMQKSKSVFGLARDDTDSTYEHGYNYYGYVTSTDGAPFPITSDDAAAYLMSEPNNIKQEISAKYWDLQLVDRSTSKPTDSIYVDDEYKFRGIFQGLVNSRAPHETPVTFCQHHSTNNIKHLPLVTLSGNAMLIKPVRPALYEPSSFTLSREIDTTNPQAPRNKTIRQAIDWRIHKAPLPIDGKYPMVQYGDSIGNNNPTSCRNMPIVETYYRFLQANQFEREGWYNSGIEVNAHDLVMIVASGKWNYAQVSYEIRGRNKPTSPPTLYVNSQDPIRSPSSDIMIGGADEQSLNGKHSGYSIVQYDNVNGLPNNAEEMRGYVCYYWDESSKTRLTSNKYLFFRSGDNLLFTPAGDQNCPKDDVDYNQMNLLLPTAPPGALIASIGVQDFTDPDVRKQKIKNISCRGSILLKGTPASGELRLSINDLYNGFCKDTLGWCEVIIAVYRPDA